jgi:hypothetical protein
VNAEQVKSIVEQRLQGAGLLSVLDVQKTQFLDAPDRIFVELVVNDAGRQNEISEILEGIETRADGGAVDLHIHPIWKIESVGEPEIARSASGGIVAARVLPISLQSGSARAEVSVAVTYLAELELKRINGSDPDLKDLARAYVSSRLKWGGESYWDPVRYSRLEIGAEKAMSLYRSFQKTA